MNTLVEYALAYAELGFYVFPCHTPIKRDGWNCSCEAWKREKLSPDFDCSNPGKHPRTQNGLDDATTDPEQIKRWWRQWPNANIGINCGQSGMLVVDLDTYKDIYQGDDLELNEETVTCLSGGGGAPICTIGCWAMIHLAIATRKLPAGIDIRGHGGYVIVPPSGHESGNEYRWELEYGPEDIDIAPIPAKLRELLAVSNQQPLRELAFDTTKKFDHNATRYGAAAIDNQISKVLAATNGTRNNTLNEAAFGLARLVAGGECDADYVRRHLLVAATAVGLSDDEARTTIESAFDAGIQIPYSTVAEEETNDGFGDFDQALFDFFDAEISAQPVTLDEIQCAIASMISAGAGIDGVRDNLWRAIGKLGQADRTLLAAYLISQQLCTDRRSAVEFVDQCARSLDAVPLIERITRAVAGTGHTFRINRLEDVIEVDGKRITDVFMSRLYLLMADQKFNRQDVASAVDVLAEQSAYHPVRDYLLSLEWDGEDHLSKFLDHLTSDDKVVTYADGTTKPLHCVVMRRWMLGCVSRAIDGSEEHAFKHQTPMLVIIGAQGQGKSSLVRWLCSGVGNEFHREGALDPHNIDDKRSMVTKWIWEVSELVASLRKADRDALKGFITQEWHTYRKPYSRYDITKPTLCNLVGTLNNETGFLDDPTGHRRFLPMPIEHIDHDYGKNVDINQLWAQIVFLYLSGESPELNRDENLAMAQTRTEYEVENPLQTYIQMYFDIDPNSDLKRCFTADIISRLRSFGVTLKGDLSHAGRDINAVLAPMGLKNKLISIDGVKSKGWIGIAPNSKPSPTG
jgi:hypothetical protein